MIWFSLMLVAAAIAGIVGCQVYLRVALRPADRQRGIERFVAACAAVATLGYGIATYNCFASQQGLAVYAPSDGAVEKFSVPSRIMAR